MAPICNNHYLHINLSMYIRQQQDQSDCGVICLQSLLRNYGGDVPLESLRQSSGTNVNGTTLLGLHQAASNYGFKSKAYQADANNLIESSIPSILHITTPHFYHHYVICYEATEDHFTIADPATGKLEHWNLQKLNSLWISKTCLFLEPKNINKTSNQILKNIKIILSFVKPDSHLLFSIIALGLISAVLGLFLSFFSQQLIDNILPKKDFIKLRMGLALFIIVLILRVSIQRTRQLNLAHQTNLFNKRINKSFFTTILNLPLVFFETRSIGDLTTRLNDIQKIQGLIALLFGSVVIEILTTLTTIGVILLYNWQSGLATSISLPLYFLVTIISRNEVNKIQKETIQLNAKTEAFYINSLLGITSIAQLNRQSHFSSKQSEVFAALQNKINDLSKIRAKMGFRLGLLNSAFLGTILIILSSQVINNSLSLGEMMAVIGFSSILGPSIGNLALIIIPFSEAKISFSRMLELLKTPTYKNNGIALNQIDSINVKHLSFN